MVYKKKKSQKGLIMRSRIFLLLIFLLLDSTAFALPHEGEKITYTINPFGKAEYNDLGLVDFQGQKLKLITFRTIIPGFDDLEKIYADPNTGLPIRVERYISWSFSKEYLTEEYSPQDNSLIIKKFINNKLVKEYSFKGAGPMHNAILLPFYLRTIKDLSVGWSFDARLSEEFKVTLVSIDKIQLPMGKFTAYHFSSSPHKFEIWISKDKYRIPLIIRGMGGLGYSMRMQSYSLNGLQADGK